MTAAAGKSLQQVSETKALGGDIAMRQISMFGP